MEVTPEFALQEVGRLYLENRALRLQIAQFQARIAEQAEAKPAEAKQEAPKRK